MSRKVLDSNIGEADADLLLHSIIADNPQLNSQIEEVRNESNVFLCEVLKIYSYEDVALVRILDTNEVIFCRLSHEILSSGMCIDYLPTGIEKYDNTHFKGKKYIQPFDDLFGIVMKVRWENLSNENVLVGYVNIHDRGDLRTSNDKGELSLKSGSSIISLDNERVNITTPHLFINGLPYNEPNLLNYYDKNESNIIINNLQESINNIESEIEEIILGDIDLEDYVKKSDINLEFELERNGYVRLGIDVGDGF